MYPGGLHVSPNTVQYQIGVYQTNPQVQVPPQMHQIWPMLLSYINHELAQRANDNTLRTFAWNCCAHNNFVNEDYFSLCQSAITYFMYMANQGLAMGPQDLAQHVAAKSTEWFVAAILPSKYQAINQYINLSIAGPSIQAAVNEFHAVVTRMRSGVSGGGMMNAQNYPGVTQTFHSQPMNQHNQHFNQMAARQQNGNNALFQNRQFPPTGYQNLDEDDDGREYYVSSSEQQAVAETTKHPTVEQAMGRLLELKPLNVPAENKENAMADEEIEVRLYEVGHNFSPTDRHPYRPAYAPSKFKMYVMMKDGKYRFGVKRTSGEKDDMDQNAHALNRNFGVDATFLTNQSVSIEEAQERMSDAISAGNKSNGEEDPLGRYRRVVVKENLMEIGFEGIWADGMVDRWRANEEISKKDPIGYKPIDIYQWVSVSLSPIICNSVEKQFLETLSEARTFSEAVRTMKIFEDGVSAGLFKVIDRRLTKALNRFIQIEMSIAGIHLDSFYTDATELSGYVAKRFYGGQTNGTLVSVLEMNQSKLISDALDVSDAELSKKLFNDLYGMSGFEEVPEESDGSKEKEITPVVFLMEPASFTLLNFDFAELDISFETSTGAVLNETSCPIFYRLAHLIYKEFGDDARHHYVKTLDGHIFEISLGYLSKDCYLVSLIK